MLIVHLSIAAICFLGILFGFTVKVPGDKEASPVFVPFRGMAGLLIRLADLKSTRKGKAGRSGELMSLTRDLSYLHPASDPDRELFRYRVKRLSMVLALLFGGNLLALCVCLSDASSETLFQDRFVQRNGYGQGEKNISLDVYVDGSQVLEDEEVVIGEQRYSEEEMSRQFEEIGQKLETEILGDNDSLDVVCYDLNLPDHLEGYPVSIEWELSNYAIMNRSGQIYEDQTVPEGTLLELTACMTYFDLEGEHSFHAVVYPRPKDEAMAFTDRLKALIENYEKESGTMEACVLPNEIDGRQITYKTPQAQTSLVLLLLIGLCCFLGMKAGRRDVDQDLKKRERQMMMDYPQIISKLSLLLGAGMTVPAAFARMSEEYRRRGEPELHFAYEEMLVTCRELSGGIPEPEAYLRFGNRCHVQKYVKLGALLSQNVRKGSSSLLPAMIAESRDAFEERKHLARKLGEEAGTKLLAPMGIMLLIAMVIVILPAFLSMNL